MSFDVFPLRFCLSLSRFFVSSFVLADSQPRSRRVAPASAVRNLWWREKKQEIQKICAKPIKEYKKYNEI